MKKALIIGSLIIVIGASSYYFFNKIYLPKIIADSIVSSEEVNKSLPKKYKDKLTRIKKPTNQAAEVIVKTMTESEITLEQILKAIDAVEEHQVHSFLAEVDQNKNNLTSADQLFDLIKKNFGTDFDIEVFRLSFQKFLNKRRLAKAFDNIERYRSEDEFVDFELLRSVLKEILIRKEKELKGQLIPNLPL